MQLRVACVTIKLMLRVNNLGDEIISKNKDIILLDLVIAFEDLIHINSYLLLLWIYTEKVRLQPFLQDTIEME